MLIQPWAETAKLDEEDDDTSYCNAQPGPAISSNNDLLIGGGGYNIYPGSQSACGTSNVTNDRFSRYYWAEDGQYGVNHNPGCPTMTWTGNTWDDTGAGVFPNQLTRQPRNSRKPTPPDYFYVRLQAGSRHGNGPRTRGPLSVG